MARIRRLFSTAGLSVAMWLSACGGGSTDNVAPVADAGASTTALAGTPVTLSGAASRDADGDALTYTWVLTAKPTGSAASLANPASVRPSITPDVPGSYAVSLIVNDGRVDSSPSTVTVLVLLSAQEQADLALATAARLKVVYVAATRSFRLEWQDSFPEGTSYQVEAEGVDGQFALVESVTGIGVANAWTRSAPVAKGPRAIRVRALHEGRAIPLLTVSGQSRWTDTVTAEPRIVMDASEPLRSTTRLSLSFDQPYSGLTWYIDTVSVGQGANSPGNTFTWNVADEASGTHAVFASVALSTDATVEVAREVVVANAKPSIGAMFQGLRMEVTADASAGVARVAATFDGIEMPDPCPTQCEPLQRLYAFDFKPLAPRSGTHAVSITVTDKLGQSAKRGFELVVKNPPTIELDSPTDGSFVFGSFRVTGRFTPDQPGTVTVKVLIDGQLLSETKGAALDKELSLGNLVPGTHTLTVTAVGSSGSVSSVQRQVAVASSAALRHSPLANGFLYAVEGDRMVYVRKDGSNAMRNVVSGSEVSLRVDGTGSTGGGISNGRFFASVSGSPDCPVFSCIYMWDPSGERRRLSQGGSEFGLWLAGGAAAWRDSSSPTDLAGFTLYDPAKDKYSQIPPPPEAPWTDDSPALAIRPGAMELFFTARPDPNSEDRREVYRWNSLTATSIRLTKDGHDNSRPSIDANRMAWARSRKTGSSTTRELVVRDIDGGPEQVVTQDFSSFVFADGVLSWMFVHYRDPRTGSSAASIEALGPAGVVMLAGGQGASLVGSSAGHVVYSRPGPSASNGRPQLWSWNAATGRHTLRVDVAPGNVRLSGQWIYFSVGDSIFRTALD